ncbi:MAG: signal recognition particle-docking protein FtsY [Deltaproteobacteria bacterium]|nr:signal recognition particle-docking protein FtsY [Deltaproteobacteria bacterium]
MSEDKKSPERQDAPREKKGFFGRLFGRDRQEEQAEEAAASAPSPASPAAEEPPTATAEPAAVPEPPTAAAPAAAAAEPDAGQEEKAAGGQSPPASTADEGEPPAPAKEVDEKKSDQAEKGRGGLFSRLKSGLSKTRHRFVGTLDNLLYGQKKIDEEFLEELEEILLTSDLGVQTSYRLFREVEERVSHQALEDPQQLRLFLQQEIRKILQGSERPWELDARPYVIMAVGVNGVGKTTTIGKLAAIFSGQGKKVILGAADTFRAAAVEQLEIWSERAGVPIVRQKMGADPAAVSFDTVQAAVNRQLDVAIIDTAGRLHTKVNLMDELKKMQRVISKALPGAPHEILLVLDANTGQNAINQARMFHEALGVTGLVMTKLDGTAKGGVIVGVCDELQLPVRYIGIGERLEDLRPFKADDFVDALFDRIG